jgi:GNAT superfamily N-acetyltransferase
MDKSRVSRKSEKVVTLRVFKTGDLNKVKSLIDTPIDADYTYYPVEFIDYWKSNIHSESSILSDARIGFVVVAELDRRIVGTGTLLGKEISRVFVTPDFQRRGIGKLIMNRLERRAAENGVKVVYLISTAVSKMFYESLGYSVIEGEVPSSEGSLAVGYFRMKKPLE